MVNDYLKKISEELGFSHKEAYEKLKIQKESENSEADVEEDIQEDEEDEEEQEELNNEIENQPDEINNAKNEIKELTKQVNDLKSTVAKQLKKLRKKPPKGKQTDNREGNTPIIMKNLYEKIV